MIMYIKRILGSLCMSEYNSKLNRFFMLAESETDLYDPLFELNSSNSIPIHYIYLYLHLFIEKTLHSTYLLVPTSSVMGSS